MDVFRFLNPTNVDKMEQGQIINGLKTKMWVERYGPAGEFKFTADPQSNVRNLLPIGSFISHVDSTDIMIVENHEIADGVNGESDLTISGRSLLSWTENRIVGENLTAPTAWQYVYTLTSMGSLAQVVQILRDHVDANNTFDYNDGLVNQFILSVINGATVPAKVFKSGTVYDALQDMLNAADAGIKFIRPGPWSPLWAFGGIYQTYFAIYIHVGTDKSAQIMFSQDTGEIVNAQYLWSNKSLKTSAFIHGKWVRTRVDGAQTHYDRRIMEIDASDIDQQYTAAPTGTILTDVLAKMQQRGTDALAAQKSLSLTKAEIAPNITKAKYRKDFDIGDIITLKGNFNTTSKARVTEYVEIEDENGQQGYPTLSLI